MVVEDDRVKPVGIGTRIIALSTILIAIALVVVGLALSGAFLTSKTRLVLATTTSTHNSGLLDFILPDFESRYNVRVDVVAVGSGQAMELAKNGDADIVLSHAPSLEEPFIQQRYGIFRWRVMYNSFAIVGPQADPAGVGSSFNVTDAFTRIWANSSTFASRADNSGTNVKELEIWGAAGLDASTFGAWYKRLGKGMGETLQMAQELEAYTLTDEGTYFSMETVLDLEELFRNDSMLNNQYSVIPVNPEKSPSVNVRDAILFAEWLVSSDTQAMIESFEVNGHQLFFPNAEVP